MKRYKSIKTNLTPEQTRYLVRLIINEIERLQFAKSIQVNRPEGLDRLKAKIQLLKQAIR